MSRRAKVTTPRLTIHRVEIPRFSGHGEMVVGAAFLPGDQLWTTRLSPVPAHSPFKEGDWVVCHGYTGEFPPGPGTRGWRGFVLGSYGGTCLRGLTDDGLEWAENWGRLLPDGTPCADGRCVCHPRDAKWFAEEPEAPEQLELFALASVFGGGR